LYEDGERIEGPHVGPPRQVVAAGVHRAVGAGAQLYEEHLTGIVVEAPRNPDPVRLAVLATPPLLAGAPAGPLVPLYLRHPDAVVPAAPKQVTA
jgi:hypothetical protein